MKNEENDEEVNNAVESDGTATQPNQTKPTKNKNEKETKVHVMDNKRKLPMTW